MAQRNYPRPTGIVDRIYIEHLINELDARDADSVTRNDTNFLRTKEVNSSSSNTEILLENEYVLVDTSSGDVTVTLPDAGSALGRTYTVKKTDNTSNQITIEPRGTSTIDQQSNLSLTGSSRPSAKLISDGQDWWVV